MCENDLSHSQVADINILSFKPLGRRFGFSFCSLVTSISPDFKNKCCVLISRKWKPRPQGPVLTCSAQAFGRASFLSPAPARWKRLVRECCTSSKMQNNLILVISSAQYSNIPKNCHCAQTFTQTLAIKLDKLMQMSQIIHPGVRDEELGIERCPYFFNFVCAVSEMVIASCVVEDVDTVILCEKLMYWSHRAIFFWLLLPAGSWIAVSHTCSFYLLSSRREIVILGSVEGVMKKRSNTRDRRGLRTCGSASLHVCDLFMLLHRWNSIFLKDLCVATRGRCVSIYYWLNKTASKTKVMFFIFVHCNYLLIGGELKKMVFYSKNIQKYILIFLEIRIFGLDLGK